MDYNDLFRLYRDAGGFNNYNGIELTKISEGLCECEALLTKNSLNPQGCAHGGLTFTMCDIAAGVAAFTYGYRVLTLNASINYLRPGRGTKLRAVGTVVKPGRTVFVCESKVYDEGGSLIVKGDFTMHRTDLTIEQMLRLQDEMKEAQ